MWRTPSHAGYAPNAPGKGTYRVGRDRRARRANTIARAEVGPFIVRELSAHEHVGEAVALGY